MHGSVGKPTLDVVKLHLPAKFIHINKLSWIQVRDDPRQPVPVTSAHHRRDPFLALRPVGRDDREGSKAPPLSEAQGSGHGLAIRMSIGGLAVDIPDPGRPKLVRKSPLPIAAAAQRARLTERIAGIVDVAEFGEAIGQSFKIRLPLTLPASFAKLARKIASQLRPRGRIFADIARREFLERRLAEGRKRASGLGECHTALFVPHCLAKGKQPHGGILRTQQPRNV